MTQDERRPVTSGPAPEQSAGTDDASVQRRSRVTRARRPPAGHQCRRWGRPLPVWRPLDWPSPTARQVALREAGHRVLSGQPVDLGWLAAALWDLADLVGSGHG